jgi:uncharacterized delta-60 repeat protein
LKTKFGRSFLAVAIGVTGILGPATGAWAASGDLDGSFGTQGKVITDFTNPGEDAARALVVHEGKILAAGHTSGDFALARYNPNGTLDTSFGVGGKVKTDFVLEDVAEAIAVDSLGRIVLAGHTPFDFALARYLPNGQLDTTFGALGRVVTDFGGEQDIANSLALQPKPDEKLVVAGSSDGDFALARYNSDGSPDLSFGLSGKVVTDFSFGQDIAEALLLQPDGKIVATGYGDITCKPLPFTYCDAGISLATALARYMPDGSPDQSFGSEGKVIVPPENPNHPSAETFAAALQTDGKIVVAGGYDDFLLRRFNPDGSLDPSFGGDGTIEDAFTKTTTARAVGIQPDGKIVAGGMTCSPCQGENNTVAADGFAVSRYLTDGSKDPNFGTSGWITTNLGGENGAQSVAFQADGKVVAAGKADGRFGESKLGLIRLLNSTAPSAPSLSANSADGLVRLTWTTPSNGGSPITGYRIHRGTSSGSKSLRASIGTANSFDDTQVTNGTTYYYQVSAVNAEGEGTLSTEVVATPKAPPDTGITSGPSGSTPSTGATFEFNSNVSPVTFECRLDDSGFSACTSPKAYSSLSEGSHTFEVRARDASGLADPTPAARSWIVDTVAPSAPNLLSPSDGSSTSNTKPPFDWSDVADLSGVTYQLQVDNSGTEFTSAEINRTGLTSSNFAPTTKLAKGTYHWRVRATDGAGNVGSWSAVYRVVIR